MHYVVGSGPAGVSCAQALAAAGLEVTILDAGQQLEPERQAKLRALSETDGSAWTPEATAFLREHSGAGTLGPAMRLAYGSDFPFRAPAEATPILGNLSGLLPSYARGGYSTVWGASVLPYRDYDLAGWPLSIRDLEPGYRAVLQWLPMAACEDSLAALFPLYRDEGASALPASRQAATALARMGRHRKALNAEGIFFGASRLAVRAHDGKSKLLCAQCGLCQYGCPREIIWSSDHALAELTATGRVHYRPGMMVRSVREGASGVRIEGVGNNGAPVTYIGSRVFLAGGVLGTTEVLLRSLGMYGAPVRIRDTQGFSLPLLRFRRTRGVAQERLHTLAQLFLDILDERISPYTIHLESYSYNDGLRNRLSELAGRMTRLLPADAVLGRLLLVRGYLHSAHSPSLEATLEQGAAGDTLRLRSIASPEAALLIRRLARKLAKQARQLGAMPLLRQLQMDRPGSGLQYGGSFAMSARPRPGETDILGRPCGLKRIHAVDATVLPSIPATPITLSVMANAWRIASAVAAGESGAATQ